MEPEAIAFTRVATKTVFTAFMSKRADGLSKSGNVGIGIFVFCREYNSKSRM